MSEENKSNGITRREALKRMGTAAFGAALGIGGTRVLGNPAAAIASCRRAGSTATLDQLNKYIVFSNMPMVPSQYWNMVNGNTPEEVRQDIEGLQIMRTLAQNMAWMLKCIDAGKQLGIAPPVYEKFTPTNFIR